MVFAKFSEATSEGEAMRIRSLIAAAAAFSSLGIMTIGSAEAAALPPGASDEFFTYSPTGALL
jgi:hypothetical protein